MHTAVSDLVVIETASVLAGPLVGQFFAELGARVVKIENPATGGDVTRQWKLASEDEAETCPAYFSSVNWGKESLALDLSGAAGKEVFFDLLEKADVWIDNFPAAALARMGLDASELHARFPRLVHARISAYGDVDARPGYDAALQAETGLMAMNGTDASGPLKWPLAMVDILAAHQLKEGALLALWDRDRTGQGREVSVSLYDSGVSTLANQGANYLQAGHVAERQGSGHPNIVPYGTVFACAGGESLVLAVGTDAQFAALCAVLGAPELSESGDFARNIDRVRNRSALESRLSTLLAGHRRDGLLQQLHHARVPAAAVRQIDEVLERAASEHLLMRDAGTGRVGLRTAVFVHGDESAMRAVLKRPPRLNEGAGDVLRSLLGYGPERVAGVVGKD